MSGDLHFVETSSAAIYDTIINAIVSKVNEPLYPGDERRIFGEALVAVFVAAFNKMDDAARQKMLRYARGEVLDALGERTGTARLKSSEAHTTLRFHTSVPAQSNIFIPAKTKVAANGPLYFMTSEPAVLQAGSTSVDVAAVSMEGGSKYNGLLPNSINTMVDLIPGISGVTNITETQGGTDGEPYTEEGDNSYRERIRLSTSKYSTAGPEGAYRYHALSADPRITSVSVVSNSPGCVTIVPLMEGGVIPTQDVLDKVKAACNASSVRPLTDYVTVEPPGQVFFDIELKYYTTAQDELAAIQTIEGTDGAIQQYIRWQTSALGRDINPDQLRRYILAPSWADGLTGALRLEIVKPIYTSVDKLSVAQFSGNLTVTHEVVLE